MHPIAKFLQRVSTAISPCLATYLQPHRNLACGVEYFPLPQLIVLHIRFPRPIAPRLAFLVMARIAL